MCVCVRVCVLHTFKDERAGHANGVFLSDLFLRGKAAIGFLGACRGDRSVLRSSIFKVVFGNYTNEQKKLVGSSIS